MKVLVMCFAHLACSPLVAGVVTPLEAQDSVRTSVGVSPYVGIGPIIDHGSLVSWTANVFVEVDLTQARLRSSLFGSVRGIGAECADGCDVDGEGVGFAVAYLLGGVGVGGGIGLLHQSSSWHLQPHVMLTAGRGAFRTQLRVEVPQGGYGISVPILFGFRLPLT